MHATLAKIAKDQSHGSSIIAETYLGRFGSEPPVRTTVAVTAIPDRTLVEMDCIAQI